MERGRLSWQMILAPACWSIVHIKEFSCIYIKNSFEVGETQYFNFGNLFSVMLVLFGTKGSFCH